MRSERGSGSVLVLGVISAVVTATVLVVALGSGLLARHDAATAADLAALAAAEELRSGSRDPCAKARSVSEANGATLRDCTVDGWAVEVATEVAIRAAHGWLSDPVRRARAGIEPPAGQLPAEISRQGWELPVPGPYRVTAGFGQVGPHWRSGRHTGIDFAAPAGTSVVASAGGRVTEAGWAASYGRLVVIDHGGAATYYAHLSTISVTVGEVVSQGQLIGAVGASGNATGPHLHFEVRFGGVPHDPATVLDGIG